MKRILAALIISFIIHPFFSTTRAQELVYGNGLLQIVDSSYTALHHNEVRTANSFRLMIDAIIAEKTGNSAELETLFKHKIYQYFMPADTNLANGLLAKIKNDTNTIKECKYLLDVKSNWASDTSSHFIFYYTGPDKPERTQVNFWDTQYNRLSKLFNIQADYKITFVIDPKDQFGRAFPPWDINMGIRQKELGENPHELVHCMLFKYSDVPFFHEPLAFIYGTMLGNVEKARERYLRYAKTLVPDKLISSTELIHFSQIIGLDDIKWASAFCFVYKLNEKFGLPKLLDLMKSTLWSNTVNDYKAGFKKIYGIELQAFEDELKADISKIF